MAEDIKSVTVKDSDESVMVKEEPPQSTRMYTGKVRDFFFFFEPGTENLI